MRSTNGLQRAGLHAALAGLILVIAACSTGGGGSPPGSTAATTSGGGSGSDAVAVTVANGAVGAYLTGREGMTLYVFTPDSANTSTCTDACAATWPPFTVAAGATPNGGDGVTGAFSTFTRTDGTQQVAYDGAPLYYYAKDAKAGDVNGQGVGGKWFVASPTGSTGAPAGSSASPTSAGEPRY